MQSSKKNGLSGRVKTKDKEPKIDAEKARFPYCIVWTPLPLITWFLPFIGHTGIAMSDGVIHDFAGPFTITVDDLAFGETHKYDYDKLTISDMFLFPLKMMRNMTEQWKRQMPFTQK